MRGAFPSARRCGNTFFLHYVVRGKGIFRRGKREYTLQAGEIFVIRPGEVTYYEAGYARPVEYMWAGFDCAPPLFAALLGRDVLRLPGALQNFFRRIAGCGDMPAKSGASARSSMSFLRAGRGPRPGAGARRQLWGQAVNYIKSNYSPAYAGTGYRRGAGP